MTFTDTEGNNIQTLKEHLKMSMTIQQFAEKHGVKAIVRRHFDYNVLCPVFGEDMKSVAPALNYTHSLEESRIGLTPAACQLAFEQGKQLAAWHMAPGFIVCGENMRNWDGARFSAAGIQSVTGHPVNYQSSPGVSYPRYTDAKRLKEMLDQHGDAAVHMTLKGDPETAGIWTETPQNFVNRVMEAVLADYPWGSTLFDLNFEALVALHYMLVEHCMRTDIPTEPTKIWCPVKGGGIVIGHDRAVAEFAPDLSLVGEIVPRYTDFNDPRATVTPSYPAPGYKGIIPSGAL